MFHSPGPANSPDLSRASSKMGVALHVGCTFLSREKEGFLGFLSNPSFFFRFLPNRRLTQISDPPSLENVVLADVRTSQQGEERGGRSLINLSTFGPLLPIATSSSSRRSPNINGQAVVPCNFPAVDLPGQENKQLFLENPDTFRHYL